MNNVNSFIICNSCLKNELLEKMVKYMSWEYNSEFKHFGGNYEWGRDYKDNVIITFDGYPHLPKYWMRIMHDRAIDLNDLLHNTPDMDWKSDEISINTHEKKFRMKGISIKGKLFNTVRKVRIIEVHL